MLESELLLLLRRRRGGAVSRAAPSAGQLENRSSRSGSSSRQRRSSNGSGRAWAGAMSVALRVALMRGGTSRGVLVRGEELAAAAQRVGGLDTALLALLGGASHGAHGAGPRQADGLDGLGGSISSTQKVGVMGLREPGVASYRFAQVSLAQGLVDWTASCGNLAAAAGLFAVEQGLLDAAALAHSPCGATHRIVQLWDDNSSTAMQIHVDCAELMRAGGGAGVAGRAHEVSIAGVPGTGPPVLVSVLGSRLSPLPTGRATELLLLRSGAPVEATLLRGANPTVFVHAAALGLDGSEQPKDIDWAGRVGPEVQHLLEQAAALMQSRLTSAMRVCWVRSPCDLLCTDASRLARDEVDIVSRITTEGRAHHAHTATGAMNLAVAAALPGTVPHAVARARSRGAPLRIGHPAGVTDVAVHMCWHNGEPFCESVGLVRTARTIMVGDARLPVSLAS